MHPKEITRRFADAETKLKRAQELSPEASAEVHYVRGVSAMKQERWDDAVQNLSKVGEAPAQWNRSLHIEKGVFRNNNHMNTLTHYYLNDRFCRIGFSSVAAVRLCIG